MSRPKSKIMVVYFTRGYWSQ